MDRRKPSLANHIILEGETGDIAGLDVAITQDVNNDGMDDILVGAYGNDTVAEGAGAVYVVYGPGASKSLSEADAKLLGVDTADLAGYSLAPAGDANGDGYGDFLVASFEADSAAEGAGAAYMVLGPPTSGSLGDEVTDGREHGDNLGYAMASGCDISDGGRMRSLPRITWVAQTTASSTACTILPLAVQPTAPTSNS